MQARLTDPDGVPLTGLPYSAQPQPFASQSDFLQIPEQPAVLAGLLPRNRRAFLLGRWQARSGQVRREESELQSFLDAGPGNLLAIYYTSLAYWANDEFGKVIDLLNRRVERAGGQAPAFLRLRARYYVQRHRYDKAQADYLQEIQLTSSARVAERDLAISGQLVSVANSAMFAPRVLIVGVRDAVVRLGLDNVCDIVMMVVSNSTMYRVKGFEKEVEVLRERGLAAALAARAMSRLMRSDPADYAFLAGLMHDIGELVLLERCATLGGVTPEMMAQRPELGTSGAVGAWGG